MPNQRTIKNPFRAIKANFRETNWIFEKQTGTPTPPPPPTPPFFQFVTNFVGTVSFSITKTGAPATWNMGDGSGYSGTNSVTHTFTAAGDKTVTVNVDAFANVQGIGDFSNKGIVAVFFSDLTNLGGTINISFSPDLTTVQLPATPNIINTFAMQNTGYVGALDISMLANLSNSILIQNNPGLTSVLLPATPQLVRFNASACNITGTLDLTPLSNLHVDVLAPNNALLTNILIGTTQQISNFRFNNCNLTGTIDLTGAPNLSGAVFLFLNPLLNNVLFAANTTEINNLNISQCNLNALPFDLSMLNLSGIINLRLNAALSRVSFPSTGNLFTQIYLDRCNFTSGSLDVAPLTNISGIFWAYEQNSLGMLDAAFLFTGNANTFTDVRLFGNRLRTKIPLWASSFPNTLALNSSLFQAQINVMAELNVNNTLINFDTNTVAGPLGRTINLSGAGNAAPTGAGITAKNNLIAKGIGVTTN